MENGKWQMDEKTRRFHFPFTIFHLPLLAAVIVGCASDKQPTTRPSTARERQEAALRDPMGYSPNMDSPDTDISGGKLHELDRKAMRKDIDHVLNP
jgi:hypothetical protein